MQHYGKLMLALQHYRKLTLALQHYRKVMFYMRPKEYTLHGFAIFPLRPNTKEPATPHGFRDATTQASAVDGFPADCNIGVATGKRSGQNGLTVVDVDIPGLPLWIDLCRHGGLPSNVPIVRTPSGGYHIWFRYCPELRTGTNRLGQGIDIRSDGGYVVAPPSKINNTQYVWKTPSASIANLPQVPQWMLDLVPKPRAPALYKTRTTTPELASVAKLLHYIPNHDRDIWIAVAMGLKEAYGDAARDIWLNWSASNYPKFNETEAVFQWNSLKRGGRTLATVIYNAKKFGCPIDLIRELD